MTDFQDIFRSAVAAQRQAELTASPQMLLGEFIALLSAIKDKDKEIVFDFDGMTPGDFNSWRGSYCELALAYIQGGKQTVAQLLEKAKAANGRVFEGYKGGDFVMGRATPIWVANYGQGGCESLAYGGNYVAIVGVEDGDAVKIITKQPPAAKVEV